MFNSNNNCFGSLSYLLQDAPPAPMRVIPDSPSGSIKLNINATKIGSVVLLIVTKIYHPKVYVGFSLNVN